MSTKNSRSASFVAACNAKMFLSRDRAVWVSRLHTAYDCDIRRIIHFISCSFYPSSAWHTMRLNTERCVDLSRIFSWIPFILHAVLGVAIHLFLRWSRLLFRVDLVLCKALLSICSWCVWVLSLETCATYMHRTDSTDSPDCLPTLLSTSIFYFLDFLFSTFQFLVPCGRSSWLMSAR